MDDCGCEFGLIYKGGGKGRDVDVYMQRETYMICRLRHPGKNVSLAKLEKFIKSDNSY